MQLAAETVSAFTQTGDDEYYLRRGIAFGAMKCYEQAILSCDEALNINDLNADAYSVQAEASYYIKDYAQALRDFDKAISLNPSLAKAFNGRAAVVSFMPVRCYSLLRVSKSVTSIG